MSYLEQLKSRKSTVEQVPKVPILGFGTIGTGLNGYSQKKSPDQTTLHTSQHANGGDGPADSDKLLDTLSDDSQGMTISPLEICEALSPEDIKEWRKGAISGDTLAAFARSLMQRREMDQGKCPDHYTKPATCKHCGPVWLWFSGEVIGCPWCWNRVADKPIPRPNAVHCGECIHFERIDHPHLGHCAEGEPEAIAGLWDTDRRYCERFLPSPRKSERNYS